VGALHSVAGSMLRELRFSPRYLLLQLRILRSEHLGWTFHLSLVGMAKNSAHRWQTSCLELLALGLGWFQLPMGTLFLLSFSKLPITKPSPDLTAAPGGTGTSVKGMVLSAPMGDRSLLHLLQSLVDYGIIEWWGLEGTFQGHPVQPPCHEQGHLQLEQVAQSPVQPDLEGFQGGGISHLSGQPGPGFHHPRHKEFFPYI